MWGPTRKFKLNQFRNFWDEKKKRGNNFHNFDSLHTLIVKKMYSNNKQGKQNLKIGNLVIRCYSEKYSTYLITWAIAYTVQNSLLLRIIWWYSILNPRTWHVGSRMRTSMRSGWWMWLSHPVTMCCRMHICMLHKLVT
jgi:hypothetical protein